MTKKIRVTWCNDFYGMQSKEGTRKELKKFISQLSDSDIFHIIESVN